MSLISKGDLARLIEWHDGKGISIFMPTHRVGNENAQDRIRLKNLLNEADEQLRTAGLSEGETRELLGPIQDQLVPQPTFWEHQLDGLCLFRSAETLTIYRLPFSFEELVIVAPRFHVKPLLPLLSSNGQFYLLALHKDVIQVYQGTKYSMSRLQLEALPESMNELLLERDMERPMQWHTETRVPGGHPRATMRPAAFHGHGVMEQHEEDDILRYYREVDSALSTLWGDEKIPLLLAGGDELTSLYRRANTYPHIVEEMTISVNPAALDEQELHDRAWQKLTPRFEAEKQKVMEDYRMWAGRDSTRASDDLDTIVSAAYFERVQVLFVALDSHKWGTFNPQTNEVKLEDAPTPENRDLLDLAAVHTLLNEGRVYAVTAAEVPGGEDVAAIFRY